MPTSKNNGSNRRFYERSGLFTFVERERKHDEKRLLWNWNI